MRAQLKLGFPLLGLLLLLAFPQQARAALNENGNSVIDPATTKVKRIGDKLHIYITKPDKSVTEIVKELEEIKPGTDFFHWTADPEGVKWMHSGYPYANLEQLRHATGTMQAYGPGFYVSISPTDSAQFGNILTHLKVPAQPSGILGKLSHHPEESFWVLKERLSFPGDDPASRKAAEATYALLEAEGIMGGHVDSNWYTIFDHKALSHFVPLEGAQFLEFNKKYPGGLQEALTNLKKFPENAPIYASVSGEVQKRLGEVATFGDLRTHLEYVQYLENPDTDAALQKKALELLPAYQEDKNDDLISRFLYFANKNKDGDFFQALLERQLAMTPKPWENSNVRSTLTWIATNAEEPKIRDFTRKKVLEAITNSKTTDELHELFSLVDGIRVPDLKEPLLKQLEQSVVRVIQGGNYGKGYPLDWAKILAEQEKPDKNLLSALAHEIAVNPETPWDTSYLHAPLKKLLQTDAAATLRPAVIKGVLQVLDDPRKAPYVSDFAYDLDEPVLKDKIINNIFNLVRAANTPETYGNLNVAMQNIGRFSSQDPEKVRQLLGLILARKPATHPEQLYYLLEGIYYYLDLPSQPDLRPIVRAFLAQLEITLPEKASLFAENTNYYAYSRSLFTVLGVDSPEALRKHANDLGFGLPPSVSIDAPCDKNFKAVGGN